jgi:hypothetical protein
VCSLVVTRRRGEMATRRGGWYWWWASSTHSLVNAVRDDFAFAVVVALSLCRCVVVHRCRRENRGGASHCEKMGCGDAYYVVVVFVAVVATRRGAVTRRHRRGGVGHCWWSQHKVEEITESTRWEISKNFGQTFVVL